MTIIVQLGIYGLDICLNLNFYLVFFMPIVAYFIYYFVHKYRFDNKYSKINFTIISTICSHLVNAFVGKIGFFTTLINQIIDNHPKLKLYAPILLCSAIAVCLKAPIASVFMVAEFSHIREPKLLFSMITSSLTTYFSMMILNIPIKHYHFLIPFNIESFIKIFLLTCLIAIVYMIIKSVFKLGRTVDEKPWYLIGSAIILMLMQYHFKYYNLVGNPNIENINAIVLLIMFLLTQTAKFKGGIIAPLIILGAAFGKIFGTPFISIGAIGLLCLVANYRYSTIILGMEMFGYENIIFYVLFILIINILKKGVIKGEIFIKKIRQ